jgi:quercetin dioxygenase-like cupin family protein
MQVQPKRSTTKGPAEMFTGDVWIDPIALPVEPAHATVNAVRFSPGARTAWHCHSLGQTLYVTDGRGLIQSRGEPIVTIHPGETIHTPPAEWHWHGATADHFMAHLSITEGTAEWGDHVTDAEYLGEAP